MTATIVNGLTKGLVEKKPSFLRTFEIPPRGDDPFSLTVIPDTPYLLDLVETDPMTVLEDGVILAESICRDYRQAMVGYSAEAIPFLFHVEGAFINIETFAKQNIQRLERATKQHGNYLKKLVDLADIDFTKYGSPAFVSEAQKEACKELGLERAWLTAELIKELCPACKAPVLADQVICQQCHCVLDMDKFKDFQFAGQRE